MEGLLDKHLLEGLEDLLKIELFVKQIKVWVEVYCTYHSWILINRNTYGIRKSWRKDWPFCTSIKKFTRGNTKVQAIPLRSLTISSPIAIRCV